MHSINAFGRTKWMTKQNCLVKFFTPLLVLLIATSFFGVFLSPDAGQTTADRTPDRIVSNEMELRNAVNNAVEPTVIAFDNDITLTEQLVIPVNKDITLTSTSKFFKLIGGDTGRSTLGPTDYPQAVINVGGVLRLDCIVVTCANYPLAWNLLVLVSGTLILYNGEISGNILGDGLYNSGTFEMYGGKISNNNANAVYNSAGGKFSLFGGEISNNKGFGVYNRGTYNQGWSYGMFSMSGGVISNNDDGGVQNSAIFSMVGGEISNNVGGNSMQSGGGVSNSGTFSMSGGVISNNQATYGGGVYNYPDGNFSLAENGVISGNKAEVGGGVYNAGTFNRRGGVISGNTATQYNDIYPNDDGHMPETEPFPTMPVIAVSALSICAIAAGLLLIRKRCKEGLHKA
jgi:hypothetical protein